VYRLPALLDSIPSTSALSSFDFLRSLVVRNPHSHHSLAMSDPTYYGARDQSASPYPPVSDMSHEDYKASYDDLIDDDASQFVPNARHQTIAVNTTRSPPAPQHKKSQSIGFALNGPAGSKGGDWDYPPQSVAKEDKSSFWARVRVLRAWRLTITEMFRSGSLTRYRVDCSLQSSCSRQW
jgi:hypothetical protein